MSTQIRVRGFLAYFGFLALLMSCGEYDANEQIDEGIVEEHIYTSHEIGWTMKIPNGWTVVSKDRLEELDEKRYQRYWKCCRREY